MKHFIIIAFLVYCVCAQQDGTWITGKEYEKNESPELIPKRYFEGSFGPAMSAWRGIEQAQADELPFYSKEKELKAQRYWERFFASKSPKWEFSCNKGSCSMRPIGHSPKKSKYFPGRTGIEIVGTFTDNSVDYIKYILQDAERDLYRLQMKLHDGPELISGVDNVLLDLKRALKALRY